MRGGKEELNGNEPAETNPRIKTVNAGNERKNPIFPPVDVPLCKSLFPFQWRCHSV